MKNIRPYKLFGLLVEPPANRVAKVMLPSHRGAGGTSMLETMLLVSASRTVHARRVFEFGTFMGTNAFNFALNLPHDGEVFTLDLDDVAHVRHKADEHLATLHMAASCMDFSRTPEESKIQRLKGNSRAFDFTPWFDSIDLAFIDGGHDLQTAKSDTEAAFRITRTDRPSCIAWHDYGNPDYPELTSYLDDLSCRYPIVHVRETMLCFLFSRIACS